MIREKLDRLAEAAKQADDRCELAEFRLKKLIKNGVPAQEAGEMAGVAEAERQFESAYDRLWNAEEALLKREPMSVTTMRDQLFALARRAADGICVASDLTRLANGG